MAKVSETGMSHHDYEGGIKAFSGVDALRKLGTRVNVYIEKSLAQDR